MAVKRKTAKAVNSCDTASLNIMSMISPITEATIKSMLLTKPSKLLFRLSNTLLSLPVLLDGGILQPITILLPLIIYFYKIYLETCKYIFIENEK